MSREPSALTKLKQFAFREAITKEDGPHIEQEFVGASDRACALLLGAIIDRCLGRIITKLIRADISLTERSEIFSLEGPLSSFWSKILFGHALGAYGQKTKHDLQIIRHVRNAFAHTRKPLRFETKAVHDVCNTLILPKSSQIPPSLMRDFPAELKDRYTNWDRSNPRIRFEVACHIIGTGLDDAKLKPLADAVLELLP